MGLSNFEALVETVMSAGEYYMNACTRRVTVESRTRVKKMFIFSWALNEVEQQHRDSL